MIKIGNWLNRCDEVGLAEDAGYNSFRAMYLEDQPPRFKTWRDVVKAYELNHITELKYGEGIQHIVVLEIYDGSINMVLSLDENESIKIYAGCNAGITNTDGSAFIQCMRGEEELAVFMIDNSPSDVGSGNGEEDWVEFTGGRDEFDRETALHEFRQHLIDNNLSIDPLRVTRENTLFVSQL